MEINITGTFPLLEKPSGLSWVGSAIMSQSVDFTKKPLKLLEDETLRANPLEFKGLEQPFKLPYATKADFDWWVHGLSDYPDW